MPRATRPSASSATQVTVSVCPFSTWTHCAVPTSHTLKLLSTPPETTQRTPGPTRPPSSSTSNIGDTTSAALSGSCAKVHGAWNSSHACGTHRSSRLWPFFDVDLNRLFPGRAGGHPPDRVAHALCQDVRGADQVVELRGARAAFREAPQALVRHRDLDAAKLAAHANVWP